MNGILAGAYVPGTGKVGAGARHNALGVGVSAAAKSLVDIFVGKIPEFLDFILRQVYCVGAHPAIGAAKKHLALQFCQPQNADTDY